MAQENQENDFELMDIIQEYPTIYNRSSRDFKDKTKKQNCWKAVAKRMNEPVDVVKRRYESIRTQFSKYLKKRKGASGAGAADVSNDPKFERLMWLQNFIISRPNSGNFQRKQVTTANRDLAEHDDNDSICSKSDDDEELFEDEPDDSYAVIEGSNEVNRPDLQFDAADLTSNFNGPVGSSTPRPQIAEPEPKDNSYPSGKKAKTETQRQKKVKMTSKKESRKREIERTDVQLNHALSCLNSSLKKTDKQDPSGLERMDEDDLYALSLAKRLHKLDSRHKALMRNGIEKLFLDIEFGGSYGFNTPQPTTFPPFQNGNVQMWQNHMQNSQSSPATSYSQYLGNNE